MRKFSFQLEKLISYAVLAVCIGGGAQAAKFKVLHEFVPAEGSGDIEIATPLQTLVHAGSVVGDTSVISGGVSFSGSASQGGLYDAGTLFHLQFTFSGYQVIPDFDFGSYSYNGYSRYGVSPANPMWGQDLDQFYTTFGYTNSGTIFSFDNLAAAAHQAGAMRVLHRFHGGSSGLTASNVLIDPAGNMFGTSLWGGRLGNPLCDTGDESSQNGCGFVFEVIATGAFRNLHNFAGGAIGGYPIALARRPDGTLVGIAKGGIADFGHEVFFTISPAGIYQVALSLPCAPFVSGKLLADAEGNAYASVDACVVGKTGAAIIKISPDNHISLFHLLKPGVNMVASFQLFGFDSAGDLVGAETQSEIGYLGGASFDTTIFLAPVTGKIHNLARQHNLALTSLFAPGSTPETLFGAGTFYGASEDLPTRPVFFQVTTP